nr:MAG TPA: hypothetical protein [Caudoviricetes sp.]
MVSYQVSQSMYHPQIVSGNASVFFINSFSQANCHNQLSRLTSSRRLVGHWLIFL